MSPQGSSLDLCPILGQFHHAAVLKKCSVIFYLCQVIPVKYDFQSDSVQFVTFSDMYVSQKCSSPFGFAVCFLIILDCFALYDYFNRNNSF